MNKFSNFIKIVFLCTFTSSLFAESKIKFYLEDEPVYTTKDKNKPGFLLEIVNEMVLRMGIDPEIEFLPWKRAQHEAINKKNGVIFPLTRTKEREGKYKWICKVTDVPVMFVTKAGSNKIATLKEVKKLAKVGVISGTPQENDLLKKGFDNIASVPGDRVYDMLNIGNVDAIYAAWAEAIIAWRKNNYKTEVQGGETFLKLPLWIATGKDSPSIDIEKWERTLKELKKSGFYDKIFKKYYGDTSI